MKKIAVTSLSFGLITLIVYTVLLITNGYIDFNKSFSLHTASEIAPFVGSFVSVFFTLAGTLLILENLRITTENNNQNQLLAHKSQFETTYFNLLSSQRQIRDSIKSSVYSDLHEKTLEESGTNFFDELATNITVEFAKLPQDFKTLLELYNNKFSVYNSDLGHYFRHMYHVVKFVDHNPFFKLIEKDVNFIKQEDYIKILRAQLSNSEITLLALNGLTEQGEGFRPLIEKYELLININLETNMPNDIQGRVPTPHVWINEYKCLKSFK